MKIFFKLDSHNTTIKREIFAGFTTFLTMAYVLIVHPSILSVTGMDKGALITVTCLSAALGSIITGLWVNVPFAMAPGMGLNAFFAYTLVLKEGATWQEALGVVFISGILFMILTISGFRSKIIAAIPQEIRIAIGAGIGFFIAFLGMSEMKLIVSDPATLVSLGKMDIKIFLGLFGFALMGFLDMKKVKGGIFIGIIVTTLLGILFGAVEIPATFVSLPPSIEPIAFKLDILGALKPSFIGAILSFMFIDLFDSLGSIVACAKGANMINKNGEILHVDKILEVDAVATVAGSLLGTSTTTIFVESAAGITDGGRTGLTAVATGGMFLLALFFSPIFSIIPSFATGPALMIVGVYMFKHVLEINFNNIEVAIPSFLTIIMMPLTFSISKGIAFGFISYIIMTIFSKKFEKITPILLGIGLFSLLEIII
ncbi:MAG: NCS2 family permease [Fusobacteriaceae bacterium]